jgi:hypothetical protein
MKLKFFPTNDPKPKKPRKLYMLLYLDDNSVDSVNAGQVGSTTCAVISHVPTESDVDNNLDSDETYLGYVEIEQ